MAEYDIGFSRTLLEVAERALIENSMTLEVQRTVLYVSLLSTEITLKHVLEKAGLPISKIKLLGHDLYALISEIDKCETWLDVSDVEGIWMPASRLRSKVVDPTVGDWTVGTMLQAERDGASNYPNAIRYGTLIAHYPADQVMKMAKVIHLWAISEASLVRRK